MATAIQSITPILSQLPEMLRQQADGAAKAIKLAGGPGKTIGDFMKAAKGNAAQQAPLHQINNEMTTLQLLINPKGSVTVQKGGNSLVDQVDQVLKSPDFKNLVKDKDTKTYYSYFQVPELEAAKRMSLFAQSVFTARAGKPKDIESAAKKQLGGAISSLVKAKKYVYSKAQADELANYAGTLKGLIEAASVQGVVKNYPQLDKDLQPLFAKWGADDVYNQTAQKIIEDAKAAKAEEGQVPGRGPQLSGRLPGAPSGTPQRRAA